MEFQVLGQISVLCGRGVVRPSGRLARTLLAVLLARCDTSVSVDALIDLMWPNDLQHVASHRLHVHVSRLRAALGDQDRLRFDQGAYRLVVLPDELDAARFRALADESVELVDEDPARCVELSRAALSLWRGEPYAGIDVPVVVAAAAHLREHRLLVEEALYSAELRLGRHAAILADVAAFAAAHPLHERIQALLITALHLGGRRAEAVAACRAVRGRLADELGVGPGPDLGELERRVVAGKPMASLAA